MGCPSGPENAACVVGCRRGSDTFRCMWTFHGVMVSCGAQIKAVCLGQSGNDPTGPDNRHFVGLRESHSGSNASVFI